MIWHTYPYFFEDLDNQGCMLCLFLWCRLGSLPLFFSDFFLCRLVVDRDGGCLDWWIAALVRSPSPTSYLRTYLRMTLTSRHWIVDFLLRYIQYSLSLLQLTALVFLPASHHINSQRRPPISSQCSFLTSTVTSPHPLPTHDLCFVWNPKKQELFSRLVCYYSPLPSPILTYSHSMCFFQLSVSAPLPSLGARAGVPGRYTASTSQGNG